MPAPSSLQPLRLLPAPKRALPKPRKIPYQREQLSRGNGNSRLQTARGGKGPAAPTGTLHEEQERNCSGRCCSSPASPKPRGRGARQHCRASTPCWQLGTEGLWGAPHGTGTQHCSWGTAPAHSHQPLLGLVTTSPLLPMSPSPHLVLHGCHEISLLSPVDGVGIGPRAAQEAPLGG